MMTVADAGGGECNCLAGTYHLDHLSGEWNGLGVGGCLSPANFHLFCSGGGDATVGDITLTLTVDCGATNTGTGSVTFPAIEWDTVDATITVPLADPSAGPCTGGGCTYMYVEMVPGWVLQADDCTDPNCNPCPNGPLNPPADPVDGQTYTEACTGSNPPSCCIGTITARITREPLVSMTTPGGAPPAAAKQGRFSLACVHRGEPTGETRSCRGCGGAKDVPLYSCAVHGVCTTERKADGVKWCRTCDEKVAPPDPERA
jgi:hypothetical protein